VLPPAPTAALPVVDGFEPARGWAGTHVAIRGRNLGADPREIEVYFGPSGAVRPLSAKPDGTELVAAVPESASAEAPLVVETPEGKGTSGGSFRYLGAGHLLRGRIATSTGIVPAAEQAFEMGGELFVWAREALDATGTVLALHRDGTSTVVNYWYTLALAPVPDAGLVALFRVDPYHEQCGGEPDCTRERGIVGLFRPEDLASGEYREHMAVVQAAFPLPNPGLAYGCGGLAVSPDGLFAVATADTRAWAVDFEWETPTVAGVDTYEDTAAPTWAFEDVFLFGSGSFLHAVVASSDYPFLPAEPFRSPRLSADSPVTALAASGHVAAVATAGGTVDLIRYPPWPPEEPPATVDFLDREPASRAVTTALEFSQDGARLVAARAAEDRLLVADVSGAAPHAVAQVEVASPRRLSRSHGYVWAAGTAGVTAVDPAGGRAASRLALHSGASVLQRARRDCFDRTRDAIFVPMPAFGVMASLDPLTLEPLSCDRPLLPWDIGRLRSLEARRGGARMVLVYERSSDHATVAVLYSPDTLDRPEPFAELASAVDGVEANAGPMAVLEGEQEVAWAQTLQGDEVIVTRVNLYSLPAADSQPGPAKTLELDGEVLALGEWEGAIVAVTGAKVTLLDREAALRGEKKTVREASWPEDRSTTAGWAWIEGGRAWLLYEGSGVQLASIALSEGAAAVSSAVETGVFRGTPLVAPGGGRLWWMSAATDGLRLRSLVLRADGTAGGEEPPVPLPAGAGAMVAYPDGEHAAVLDPVAEKVVLLE